MPEPAERMMESPPVEILPPTRHSRRATVICDCCRQLKSKDEFDEDAFDICTECLDSDLVLVDFATRLPND